MTNEDILTAKLEIAVDRLEALAKLGNEPNRGNSLGNDLAISTLNNIKDVPFITKACLHRNSTKKSIGGFCFRICDDCGYQWKV